MGYEDGDTSRMTGQDCAAQAEAEDQAWADRRLMAHLPRGHAAFHKGGEDSPCACYAQGYADGWQDRGDAHMPA